MAGGTQIRRQQQRVNFFITSCIVKVCECGNLDDQFLICTIHEIGPENSFFYADVTKWSNLPLVATNGVVDTNGQRKSPENMTKLVSTKPVVHLVLRISPRIFEQIWNVPSVIIMQGPANYHEKKSEAKNLLLLLTAHRPTAFYHETIISQSIFNIKKYYQTNIQYRIQIFTIKIGFPIK